jgi:segregation and condensation protein B
MNSQQLKNIIEAALLAADRPLSVDQLAALFAPAQPGQTTENTEDKWPTRDELRQALATLQQECESRGIELKEVSSGYRFQVKQALAPWISRLWEERAPRYSRALLETLALIAYRQPITRAEIEDIRGVAVSSNIIKTLQEREWVRVLGHREVPGRPALYGTTREFLDFFSLRGLGDLPTLAEISSLDDIPTQMHLNQSLNQSEPSPMPDNNNSDNTNIVQLYPVASDAGADTNEASAHG